MSKITDLAAAAVPLDPTDLVEVVQQVGSTPINKKVAVADLGGGGGGGVLGHDSGDAIAGLWYPTATNTYQTPPDFLRSIAASEGDLLEYACGFMWTSNATPGHGRIAVVNSAGAFIRVTHSGTGGLGSLYSTQHTGFHSVSAIQPVTVQAGDLDGGMVYVTLQVSVPNTAKGVYTDSSFAGWSRLMNFGAI